MEAQQATHLKNISTGRMFVFTEILAQRSDMLPCDAEGQLIGNIVDADGMAPDIDRPQTKYLGNPGNGQLYPYNDILARRPEMVSVNSAEEWAAHQGKVEQIQAMKAAGSQSEVKPTVVLTRQASAVNPLTPADSQPLSLPDIAGLRSRDAKNKLAVFMQHHLGVKVSQQPKLDDVVAECRRLVDEHNAKPPAQQASGGN